MSLKEKLINILLGIIFAYLRKYPKINTYGIVLASNSGEKSRYIATFTIVNGTEIHEGCASDGATLRNAITYTKRYIDHMVKGNAVWVRLMPECRVFNGWYYIRARFATLPKDEAENWNQVEASL